MRRAGRPGWHSALYLHRNLDGFGNEDFPFFYRMGLGKANKRPDARTAQPVEVPDEPHALPKILICPFREICILVGRFSRIGERLEYRFFKKFERSLAPIHTTGLCGFIPRQLPAIGATCFVVRFFPAALVEHKVAAGCTVESSLPSPVMPP